MDSNNPYALDWHIPHCQFWYSLNAAQSNRMFLNDNPGLDYRLPQLSTATGKEAEEEQLDVNESWGLTTRQDLYQQIWQLLQADVHGQKWQEDIRFYLCHPRSAWEQFLQAEDDDYQRTLHQFAEMVAKLVGSAGIRSWDYSRGVAITRYGLCSGWIEPDHAAYLMNCLAHEARAYYRDWRHYNLGVLLGRITWLFFGKTMAERRRCLSQLLTDGFPEQHAGYDDFFQCIYDDKDCPVNYVPWDSPLPTLTAPQSLIDILNEGTRHD